MMMMIIIEKFSIQIATIKTPVCAFVCLGGEETHLAVLRGNSWLCLGFAPDSAVEPHAVLGVEQTSASHVQCMQTSL